MPPTTLNSEEPLNFNNEQHWAVLGFFLNTP